MKLKQITELLRESGIDSPEYDARELWKSFSGFSVLEGYKESESESLLSAVKRRCEREPLQYIIGSVGFYREEYRVTPDCLIPRSDTELLVDYAVKNIPHGESFLDLCTGSGCIAISTLCNTRNTTAVAVDVSSAALKIAKENAIANGVGDRIEFIECDLMDRCDELIGKYYAVLSNPPYVKADVYKNLAPEIYREPEAAFVGGDDGMDFYKRIIPLALGLLKEGGFIGLEIGFDQAEPIRILAKAYNLSVEIIKDYSDNDRVAILRR